MSILDSIYGAASGVASAISQAVSPVVSAVTSIPAAVVSNISSGLSSSGQSSYNTVLASQPTTPNGETYVSTPQPVYIPSPVSNAFQSFISPVIAPTIPPVSIPSVIAGEGTQPLLSSLPQYAAPQTIPGKVQDLNAEIQAAGGTITDIGGKLYGPAAKGYQPVTPVYTTPAYQSSLAIKGMGEPITQEQEISSDVTSYVPYGNYAQTELKNTKIVSEPTGDVDIYQQTHPGSSLWNLVSSGSRAALQSGAFTVGAPETPIVYTQESGGTKLASSASVSEAAKIFANPTSYSRLGSEVYGGYVQPLTGKTVQETGAKLSTYANPLNLANLVSPTAVNLLKAELPTVSPPWSISASSPAIQELTESGLSGGVTPRSASVASAMPTQDISTLPAPFKSTVATTPPSSGGGPIEVLASNLFQGKLPSVGELWASTPIARIASNWTWKTPSTAEGWVKGLTSAPTVGTLSDQYQKTTTPTQKFLDTLSIIPGGSEIKEAGAVEEAEQLIPKFSMNIQDIGNIPKQYFNVEEMIPKSSLTGVEELKFSKEGEGALSTMALPVIGAATLGGGALAYSKTLPNLQQVMSVPPSPGGATTGNVLTDTLNEIGGAYKMASGSLRSLEPGGSIGTPVGAFALDKLIGLPLSIISPLTGGKVWTPGADYMAKMGLSGTTESKEFNTQQANIEAQRPFYDALGKTIEEQKTQIDTLTAGKINAQGQFTGTDAEYAKIQAVQSSLQSNVDKYNAFQNKSQDVLTSGYKSGAIIKTSGGYEVAPEAERPYGLFSDWSNSVQKMLAGATPSQFETYEASPAFQNAKPYVNQDILNLLGPVGWLAGATINKPQFGEGAYRTITNPSEVIGSGIQGLELYAGGEVLGAVGGAFGAAEGVAPVGITQKAISILGSPVLKYGVGGAFIGSSIYSAAGGFNADLTPKVGEAKFASNLGSMTTNLYMMSVGAAAPGIASRAVDYLPSVVEGARRVYEATNFPDTPTIDEIGGWLKGKISDIFTSGPKVSKSGLLYDYDVTPTRVAETGEGYELGGINQYPALPETTTFPRSAEPLMLHGTQMEGGKVEIQPGHPLFSWLGGAKGTLEYMGNPFLEKGGGTVKEKLPAISRIQGGIQGGIENLVGKIYHVSPEELITATIDYASANYGKIAEGSRLEDPIATLANAKTIMDLTYGIKQRGTDIGGTTIYRGLSGRGISEIAGKKVGDIYSPGTGFQSFAKSLGDASIFSQKGEHTILEYTPSAGVRASTRGTIEGVGESVLLPDIYSITGIRNQDVVESFTDKSIPTKIITIKDLGKKTGRTPTSEEISYYTGKYGTKPMELKGEPTAKWRGIDLAIEKLWTPSEYAGERNIPSLNPVYRSENYKDFVAKWAAKNIKEVAPVIIPHEITTLGTAYDIRTTKAVVPAFGDISASYDRQLINIGKYGELTGSSSTEIFKPNMDQYAAITGRKYLEGSGSFGISEVLKVSKEKHVYPSGQTRIFDIGKAAHTISITGVNINPLMDIGATSEISPLHISMAENILNEPAKRLTKAQPKYTEQDLASTITDYTQVMQAPKSTGVSRVLRTPESERLATTTGKSYELRFPGSSDINEYLRNPQMTKDALSRELLNVGVGTETKIVDREADTLKEVSAENLFMNEAGPNERIGELMFGSEQRAFGGTADILKEMTVPKDTFEIRRTKEIAKYNENAYYPELLGGKTTKKVISKNQLTPMVNIWKPNKVNIAKPKLESVGASGKGSATTAQKPVVSMEEKLGSISYTIEEAMSHSIPEQKSQYDLSPSSSFDASGMMGFGRKIKNIPTEEEEPVYNQQVPPGMNRPTSGNKLRLGLFITPASESIISPALKFVPLQGQNQKSKQNQNQRNVLGQDSISKSISDSVQKLASGLALSSLSSQASLQLQSQKEIQDPTLKTEQEQNNDLISLTAQTPIQETVQSSLLKQDQITDQVTKQITKEIPPEKPTPPEPIIPVLPLLGGSLPGGGGGGGYNRRFKKHTQLFEYGFRPDIAAVAESKLLKAGSNIVFGQKSSLPTFGLAAPKPVINKQPTQRPAQVQQKPPVRMMVPPPTQKKLSTPQFKMPIIGVAPRAMPKVSLPKFNIPMQQKPVKSAPRVAIKVSTPQFAQFKMPSIKTGSNTGLKSMSLPSSLPKKKKGKK